MESIGRDPEAADSILTNMILVVAFVEVIAIYTLVVVLAISSCLSRLSGGEQLRRGRWLRWIVGGC